MTSLYKGEYLDVSTLYIGQKIEDGFKLIRDQMSASDPTNAIAELTVTIRHMRTEQASSRANIYNMLDTIVSRLQNTNRHLTNLEYLAPPAEVEAPKKKVVKKKESA